MTIDWPAKARRSWQLLAFCLAIATFQYGFAPERTFAVPLVCYLYIIWFGARGYRAAQSARAQAASA